MYLKLRITIWRLLTCTVQCNVTLKLHKLSNILSKNQKRTIWQGFFYIPQVQDHVGNKLYLLLFGMSDLSSFPCRSNYWFWRFHRFSRLYKISLTCINDIFQDLTQGPFSIFENRKTLHLKLVFWSTGPDVFNMVQNVSH